MNSIVPFLSSLWRGTTSVLGASFVFSKYDMRTSLTSNHKTLVLKDLDCLFAANWHKS